MSSFSNVIAAALFALAVVAPAQAMTDSERERLAEYERFAGEPVKDMPFWRLQSYEALGNEAVVVWTLGRPFVPGHAATSWGRSMYR